MDVLGDLNDEQRRAVETAGPLIITAGPGTGKTKTLTAKIAYLLQRGVAADDILALTFTNKAGEEMRERVRRFTPSGSPLHKGENLPFIGTFHGLALKLLSQTREVKIVSEDEQKEIVRAVVKELKLKLRVHEALRQISKQKSTMTEIASPALYKVRGRNDGLVAAYDTALREKGLYDFDDLLLELLPVVIPPRRRRGGMEAFSKDAAEAASSSNKPALVPLAPPVGGDERSGLSKALENGEIARRWKYTLVDEFQDTNQVQYELVKQLADSENICVIGDPRQSIYSFRGGDPKIFDQFMKDFSAAQEITLVKNYRSSTPIINVTSTLFPDAPALRVEMPHAGQVALVTTLNEHTEARWILSEIGRRMGGMDLNDVGESSQQAGARFSDFAVIYRVHEIGRQLETLFAEHGVPYQVIGGANPHEHSDIEHDKVVLMTMHAAKGLEFDHVFIAGFEEGFIPYTRRGESEAELAEEKRLLYVALTRARKDLSIVRPLYRRRQKTRQSRFEEVLGRAALVRVEDAAIATWQKKRAKEREKKRQRTLF